MRNARKKASRRKSKGITQLSPPSVSVLFRYKQLGINPFARPLQLPVWPFPVPSGLSKAETKYILMLSYRQQRSNRYNYNCYNRLNFLVSEISISTNHLYNKKGQKLQEEKTEGQSGNSE